MLLRFENSWSYFINKKRFEEIECVTLGRGDCMTEIQYKEVNLQKKLERKSKLFSRFLSLLFKRTRTELIVFMLDAYSNGLRDSKNFDNTYYSELKRKIKVVPK